MIQHLDQNIDYRTGQNWRIAILLIWIFSGIGIPILQFSASLLVWMGLLFLMCFKTILRLPFKTIFLTALIICLYFMIFLLKGAPMPLFVGVAILSALFVLSNYLDGSYKFFYDFSRLCKGFMYLSLLSMPIMIFASSLLIPVTFGYSTYGTFGGVLWFVPVAGPSFFDGFRFTGIVWEPGIWQIFLNINLLYALYEKRSSFQIFLALVASISCFSTTGFIVLGLTVMLYAIFFIRKLRFNQFLISGLVGIIALPLILDNFTIKVFEDAMGSGATRIADFFTGLSLLLANPILGADVEAAVASNNELIYAIKESFWRGNYWDGAFGNYMKVSNSNGYVIFLLDWGLLFGILFLLNLFRTNLTPNREFNIVCILIILASMSAEAISRTSFFYFFILAAIFIKKPTKRNFHTLKS
tara:strand:- start:619 stop:1857 length:1239 start_codon:yes stop_codon:yes gene_type:complete